MKNERKTNLQWQFMAYAEKSKGTVFQNFEFSDAPMDISVSPYPPSIWQVFQTSLGFFNWFGLLLGLWKKSENPKWQIQDSRRLRIWQNSFVIYMSLSVHFVDLIPSTFPRPVPEDHRAECVDTLIIHNLWSGKFKCDRALKSPELEKKGAELAQYLWWNSLFWFPEVITETSTHGFLKRNFVSVIFSLNDWVFQRLKTIPLHLKIPPKRAFFVWKPLSRAILLKLTPTSKFPRTANGRLIFSWTESV